MGLFNKGMKIGEGQKFDITQVSKEGLSAEDIEKMNKAAKKLIDIYNTDGAAGLSQIELAKAMDGFYSADANGDGKLTDKELDAYAKKFNEERGLTGDNAVSGKDFKSLLKEVRKYTKGDAKASTATTIDDATIADWTKEQGLTAVDGHPDVYQKDGKYTMIVRGGEELQAQRVVLEGDNFRTMTQEEFEAENAQERQSEIEKKAGEGGYSASTSFDGLYFNSNNEGSFIYDDNKKDFVRAKYDVEKDAYVAMTPDEIKAEDEKIEQQNEERETEAQKQQELQTPKDYTVQLNESLTSILTRSLEAQGIEVTEENLAKAKEEFIKNNPNALHGPKGREYLWAGDVVQVAGNLENKANADDVKAAYTQSVQSNQQRQQVEQQQQKTEAEVKTEAEKKENAENKGPQPIKLKGADPETGKVGNQDYTTVTGKGLCKYNPDIKGYELFTGRYNGYDYKNGKKIYKADNLGALKKDLMNYDKETGWSGDLEKAYLAKEYNQGAVKGRKNCISNLSVRESGNNIVVYVEYKGNGVGRSNWNTLTYKNTSTLNLDISQIYNDAMKLYSKAWW